MNITVLRSCGSTNTEARDKESYRHGDVIVALEQTAGRGQRGRSWNSRPGENLTFSLVLEPTFMPAARQFLLSEAVALSVAEAVSAFGPQCRVKWTNDVYVDDRKICGMLLEHDLSGEYLSRTIAGIGINVNQTDFPADILNPTSIALETGTRFDIIEVLDRFVAAFEKRYARLESGDLTPLEEEYAGMLYRLGETHTYMIPEKGEIRGIIRGVGPGGELLVETDGKVREYLFKEIEFRI